MKTFIFGIDVATVPSKVGLALADLDSQNKATLLNVQLCGKGPTPAQTVADWIRGQEGRVLLAMDAPLGWPKAMGNELSQHSAGKLLSVSPNDLFRRETDRYIQEKIKKTPLDVGADRIARTAHAALKLLADLRKQLGKTIPLAWLPDFTEVAAIEVYPAATLKVLGIRSSGYKLKNQEGERSEILKALSSWVEVGQNGPEVVKNPDLLDAVVCVVAGLDFISGRAMPPLDRELAEREGWIWVRSPKG
jgi:hypothetical protein